MSGDWLPPTSPVTPPPATRPDSFWSTPGGVTLIVVGSLVVVVLICVAGCVGLNIVGPSGA